MSGSLICFDICERLAVSAKSCYKYSGLPAAHPLKAQFNATLFIPFFMQYISHDFVTEDIKQELLPSTVTKKGSTIKTNCSDLILKPKLGSNNHIHHLKLKNRETRFFFDENHLWFGVDFHWAPLLYIVWTPKCPNKPYNLGPRKGPQSVSITLTKSLRSQVEISKFWEY